MRARPIILAALMAGAVAAPVAQASPYAGQYHYLATGTVAFKGADGAGWLLAVAATANTPIQSRPEQRLYLDLNRCVASSCVTVGKWSRTLTTAEVSISTPGDPLISTQASTARLRTVLGGQALDVSLSGDAVGGGTIYGLRVTTSPRVWAPPFRSTPSPTASSGSPD